MFEKGTRVRRSCRRSVRVYTNGYFPKSSVSPHVHRHTHGIYNLRLHIRDRTEITYRSGERTNHIVVAVGVSHAGIILFLVDRRIGAIKLATARH